MKPTSNETPRTDKFLSNTKLGKDGKVIDGFTRKELYDFARTLECELRVSEDRLKNSETELESLRHQLAVKDYAVCETCDGTGDMHRIDGEWIGECPFCKTPRANVRPGGAGNQMTSQQAETEILRIVKEAGPSGITTRQIRQRSTPLSFIGTAQFARLCNKLQAKGLIARHSKPTFTSRLEGVTWITVA